MEPEINDEPPEGEPASRRSRLESVVSHAAHLLPVQGPIGVFVHHNTLHAFEHLRFEEAVAEASRIFGAEPYLSEPAYRKHLAEGRIRLEDLDAILAREPDAPVLTGRLNRRELRRAMLVPGVHRLDPASIDWQLDEGGLLTRFRPELDDAVRARLIEQGLPGAATGTLPAKTAGREWQAVETLFARCFERVRPPQETWPRDARRPQEGLIERTGVDLDEVIHPLLIRLAEVFLDQGLSYWAMPLREEGFYRAVRDLLSRPGAVYPRYLERLGVEFAAQLSRRLDASSTAIEALDALGVPEAAWEALIQAELLALPGWAGLMRRLEEEPHLAPYERIPCSLMDFLAVRLTMARVAATAVAASHGLGERLGPAWQVPVRDIRSSPRRDRLVRAAVLFDVAQLVGLSATDLAALEEAQFRRFEHEVAAFDDLERRRLWHLAYEYRHEREVLGPLALHLQAPPPAAEPVRPAAQVFFCLDEREESTRRHLEETDPAIETFGAAGFFGIAVNYTGIDDAHGAALCPVVVRPAHAVHERPVEQDRHLHRARKTRRLLWARLTRTLSVSSRTLVRGWVSTSVLGVLSLFPLVARVLAPRPYARLREALNRSFFPEPRTELTLMRSGAEGHMIAEGTLVGFATQEKIERVASVLGPAGMRRRFARLVVIIGHGSTSLNNPHESAHDCGACGGRRGGPNARLFAAMANRPDVRKGLRSHGIEIAEDTWFLGGYHDSCSDDIELFDEDLAPPGHAPDIERLKASLDRARAWSAHERSRRFEAAHPEATPELALRHVEERSEHLAEPRPEYGHATNAFCVIGRRSTTRGLFLDRRAFLVSYDAAEDPDGEHLARLLAAVVPVCAGINLEYYFSFVDNQRYGCGTKLPHNVTGLVGVMNGHASDLRTGLPWQMVEIHEPVRCLFVIESTPERIRRTIEANPALARLVLNRWIRLAALDPAEGAIHVWRDGVFEPFEPGDETLPEVASSVRWYQGRAQHLPVARIRMIRSERVSRLTLTAREKQEFVRWN